MRAACALPWGGAHRTAQAPLSLTGGALHTQAQVGTADGVAERQQSGCGPQLSWGAGKDPAGQPGGGGSQALSPAATEPHPTEPQ